MASERRRYLLHFGVKLIVVEHGAKNFLDICGGWSGIVFFCLLRACMFSRMGSKWLLSLSANDLRSTFLLCSARTGKFEVIVSLYSESATSGLVNHSQVNGCNRLNIFDGSGASSARPYGVMKLLAHCCHHWTPSSVMMKDFGQVFFYYNFCFIFDVNVHPLRIVISKARIG